MVCSPPCSSVHEISQEEYWSGLPFPFPGDLPDPGTEPVSPASPALAGGFFTTEPPGKHIYTYTHTHKYMYVCVYMYVYEVAQSYPTLWDPMDSSLHQAPPSIAFPRQEYWSGLPFLSPGDLPDPGSKPRGKHVCVCVCVCDFFLIKGNSRAVIKRYNNRSGWMGGWAICLRLPHLAVDSSAHGKKCFSATYKNRTEMLCWSESRNQKEFLRYPFFNWLPLISNLRECDFNDDDLWVEWGRKEKNSLLKVSKK